MDDSGFKQRRQTSDPKQATTGGSQQTPGVFFGMIIAELMCAGYRVEVYGQEYLRQAQGALVVSNHRRDSDGPIIANALLQRRGLHIDGVAPYFVAREDLFRKGFLEHYLHNWPALARTLLGGLSMGSMLYAMHLRPMRRIQELTMGELLSDVCTVMGDVPLSQVLRGQAVSRFARQLGHPVEDLRVTQALGASGRLLYQRHAYRRLTREGLRQLMPYERNIINRQLQVFADLLDGGETVILEPEGRVSPDGHFHRPRQALHYLLNAPSKFPRVLPVALSYDFLRRGRPRVLVRFGPLRDDLSGLDRRQTNQAAQQAVLELWTVNASHLAARYLQGEKAMRLERRHHRDLDRFVAEMAERCRTLGVPVDPDLLDAGKRQTRIRDCLSFCRKRKSHHAKRELMFLNNELQAIAAIHPGLLSDLPQ